MTLKGRAKALVNEYPKPTRNYGLASVYLPDSCLQGEELPAHVLWSGFAAPRVRVRYPRSLKLDAIYNSVPEAVRQLASDEIEVDKFEVPGYLGLLFRSNVLDAIKKTERVAFSIRSPVTGQWEEVVKQVDLFRPSLKVQDIPERIEAEYDAAARSHRIKGKIRMRNQGDGTAIILVNVDPSCSFKRSQPEGAEDFAKAFLADVEPRLHALKLDWPAHSSFIDDFVEVLGQPVSLDAKTLNKVQAVFRRLAEIAVDQDPILESLVTILAVSYLRNIQLITELGSFMNYLNSIGEGRVVLLNSVEVLKPSDSAETLTLELQMTDLAYNKYEPVTVGPIPVTCGGRCEIPVHMLFDWAIENDGGEDHGGRRDRSRRSRR